MDAATKTETLNTSNRVKMCDVVLQNIRFSQGALTTRAALRWAATGGGHNWCSFTMFYNVLCNYIHVT